MSNELHIPWPTRPDGSNMSIGEMSPEDRKAQIAAAARRFQVKHGKQLHEALKVLAESAAKPK